MTSGDNKNQKQSTGRQTGSTGRSTKPQSAQARARAAKKAVTIDLEAKDVTPKTESKTEPKADTKSSTAAKSIEKDNKQSPTPKTEAARKATGMESKSSDKPSGDAPAASKGTSNQNSDGKTAPSKPDVATAKQGDDEKAKDGVSKVKVTENGSPAKQSGKAQDSSADKPMSPSKQATEKGGFVPNLAAAVIGGIIATVGFIGLQLAEVFPSFGGDGDQLTARLVALEERPALDAVSTGEFTQLAERLDEIEAATQGAGEPNVPEEITARLTALEARLADAEASLSSVAGADGGNGEVLTTSQGAAMAERLAAIEARLSASENTSLEKDVATIRSQVENVEDKIASLTTTPANAVSSSEQSGVAPQGDSASLTAELADIRTELEALKSTGEANSSDAIIATARQAIVPELMASLTAIKGDQDTANATIAEVTNQLQEVQALTTKTGETLDALSGKVESVEGTVAAQTLINDQLQASAKSLALSDLKRVAQEGGQFDVALAVLGRTGVSSEAMDTLQPFAATGVKDQSTLKSELDNLITLAAVKSKPATSNEEELTTLEKLALNARSLIKVRPVSGAGAPADPLNNLTTRFSEGDMDGFLEIWSGLQDDQKALFNQWLVEWKANLALSSLIFEINQSVAEAAPDANVSQ